MNRYSRQTVFPPIGEMGQKKLQQSCAVIVGVGALGTVSANCLCRAGIGKIRLIDRDYVDKTNLQRQILFCESDAEQRLPKAVAAAERLSKINSEITIEPIIADLNAANIEQFLDGADVVLDALDNWDARFLLNEACHKNQIAWIYGAALGSEGATMNILPQHDFNETSNSEKNNIVQTNHTAQTDHIAQTNHITNNIDEHKNNPCLRCFIPDSDSEDSKNIDDSKDAQTPEISEPPQTCSTAGVLNMATGTVAAIQSAEAVKILLRSPDVRRTLLKFDIWRNRFQSVLIPRESDCPVCVHRKYAALSRVQGTSAMKICGKNVIQVTPKNAVRLNLETAAATLRQSGQVQLTPYMLNFDDGVIKLMLFPDGRALIENALDENAAKSVYSEYVGL